ncbi:hypothetical protein BC941DRAFT_475953 [Chlamydoabsidia padenii]|nr:hypothetical protein BC941DRAFT_475953 [Chlamydoabsidia padenii]
MNHQARTVWYRFLVQKVPIQRHRIVWDHSSTLLCPICNTNYEDIFHMAVGCSFKQIIWGNITTTYLPPYLTIHDIYTTITTLTTSTNINNLAQYYITSGTVLHHIWWAHWRCLLYRTTFDLYIITDSIITTLASTLRPTQSPTLT